MSLKRKSRKLKRRQQKGEERQKTVRYTENNKMEIVSPSNAVDYFFFRATPMAYEVPQPGVESELQLPAYTTATATWEPSLNCNLHHSSQKHWILNLLSKDRDRTCILMDTSQVCYHRATTRTPQWITLNSKLQ